MTVVMLAGRGSSTWVVYNALRDDVSIETVVLERPPSQARLLRRRAQRLGWSTVAGQAMFVAYARATAGRHRARVAEILGAAGLSAERPSDAPVVEVESVNDDSVIALLRAANPSVVIVNGTRIVSERVLSAVEAPFLNLHAGITPRYRGVHGCYWALANGDPEHAGVTVHVVDPGVDTGPVVAQALVRPIPDDGYHTFPALQLAAGVPLLREAVVAAGAGRLTTIEVGGESRLYYHPTIGAYLRNRRRLGLR